MSETNSVLNVPLRINGVKKILQIPSDETELFDKLMNDNEFTVEYVNDLVKRQLLDTRHVSSIERIFDNDIEFVYEESYVSNEEVKICEKNVWSLQETNKLLRSVERRSDEINNPAKRKFLWFNVASDLQCQGIGVDSNHVKRKWNNLLRTYRCCLSNKSRTGREPTKFPFFEKLHEIISKNPRIPTQTQIVKKTFSSTISQLQEDDNTNSTSEYETTFIDGRNNDNFDSDEIEDETVVAAEEPVANYRIVRNKKKNTSTKWRSYFYEYMRIKSEFYKKRQEEQRRRNNLLERKLMLMERRVEALEKLVTKTDSIEN